MEPRGLRRNRTFEGGGDMGRFTRRRARPVAPPAHLGARSASSSITCITSIPACSVTPLHDEAWRIPALSRQQQSARCDSA